MEIQSSQNCNSGVTENESQDFQELPSNNNNHNNTDPSYTNHINQSIRSEGMIDAIDEKLRLSDYIEQVKANIEYEHHMKYDSQYDRDLYDELFEVICEVVCIMHETVRIGSEDYPYELVKKKFLKLNESHLQYVIDGMQKMTGKITNVKAYMVTALYNAPSTMKHYYQQEVNHDMYGGGWREKGIT